MKYILKKTGPTKPEQNTTKKNRLHNLVQWIKIRPPMQQSDYDMVIHLANDTMQDCHC